MDWHKRIDANDTWIETTKDTGTDTKYNHIGKKIWIDTKYTWIETKHTWIDTQDTLTDTEDTGIDLQDT